MSGGDDPEGPPVPDGSPQGCRMLYEVAALCRRLLPGPEPAVADTVNMGSALIYVAERLFVEAVGPRQASAMLRRAADHLDAQVQ